MRYPLLALPALSVLAACGGAAEPARAPVAPPVVAAPAPEAREPSDDEKLAAIQKAMNELGAAVQQCWASAATQRFDIEGELTLQIAIAAGGSTVDFVQDTARNPTLTACVRELVARYRFAPPILGQTIQLPFKLRAPDGQSTIDRALVPWRGQADVSVAVLLDENNSGNDAASMFELAIAAGHATGLRAAERAELWYFLGAGQVTWAGAPHPVAAGDMLFVPAGAARDVAATGGDVHAMIVMVPGGREGAARAGALPTRSVDATAKAARAPIVLPAAAAKTYGPATIFGDAQLLHEPTLAASVLAMPAGGDVAEHVHARETELLYVLAGSGTMTVNGVALPVTATSVVQVPRNTRHSFHASTDFRAVQLYTPAGPEQRFKQAAPSKAAP